MGKTKTIEWSTYYGGTGADRGWSVFVNASDNVYLAGSTTSSSGIASRGFQNPYAGSGTDGLLIKFNSSGVRQWATYY